MKYMIKKGSKQKVLDLIIERNAATSMKARNLVLKNKPMFLPKWLRYLTIDELDLYLEPEISDENVEVETEVVEEYPTNQTSNETTEILDNLDNLDKVEDNYYGI